MKKNVIVEKDENLTQCEFGILAIENCPFWINKPRDKYQILELPDYLGQISWSSYNDFVSIERKYDLISLPDFINFWYISGFFEKRFTDALIGNKYIDYFREKFVISLCLIVFDKNTKDNLLSKTYLNLYELNKDVNEFRVLSQIDNLNQFNCFEDFKQHRDFNYFVNLFNNIVL